MHKPPCGTPIAPPTKKNCLDSTRFSIVPRPGDLPLCAHSRNPIPSVLLCLVLVKVIFLTLISSSLSLKARRPSAVVSTTEMNSLMPRTPQAGRLIRPLRAIHPCLVISRHLNLRRTHQASIHRLLQEAMIQSPSTSCTNLAFQTGSALLP